MLQTVALLRYSSNDSYKHSYVSSYDEMSSDVIKDCFSEINDRIKYLLEKSIDRELSRVP